eukprot:1579626-Rhodomonas_salina.1
MIPAPPAQPSKFQGPLRVAAKSSDAEQSLQMRNTRAGPARDAERAKAIVDRDISILWCLLTECTSAAFEPESSCLVFCTVQVRVEESWVMTTQVQRHSLCLPRLRPCSSAASPSFNVKSENTAVGCRVSIGSNAPSALFQGFFELGSDELFEDTSIAARLASSTASSGTAVLTVNDRYWNTSH